MKKLLICAAFVALTGSTVAQDAVKPLTPVGITWRNAPVPGVQVANIHGDPAKAGEFYVQRLKFPANFQIGPHTHPYEMQIITVISGSVGVGFGEKFEKKGEMLKPGSVFIHPGKPAHYLWTGNEEAIVQQSGIGPAAGIQFVNPADDPRKK